MRNSYASKSLKIRRIAGGEAGVRCDRNGSNHAIDERASASPGLIEQYRGTSGILARKWQGLSEHRDGQ